MAVPPDPNDREKSLAGAALKIVTVLVLVIAIYYASQYAAYTFMAATSG